jgi:hypothetical protein
MSAPAALPAPVRPPRMAVPGSYPWDHWERAALAAGLAADLATLGRAVMREARQHAWCERLKKECGWRDGGGAMLERAMRHAGRTAARWNWLMQTDGLRFDPWDHDEYYEDSPCWKTMRARWNREQARLASSRDHGSNNQPPS